MLSNPQFAAIPINTWFVQKGKTKNYIFEFSWFLEWYSNVIFFNNSFPNYLILDYLFFKKFNFFSFVTINHKKLNQIFLENSLKKNHKKYFVKVAKKYCNPLIFFSKNETLKKNIQLYFAINQSSASQNFFVHASFRLMYLVKNKDKYFIFNPQSFLKKWHNIYTFVFNVFYYKSAPVMFGSNFFKKEVLAFNWLLHVFKSSTWRLFSLFFTFKLTAHNRYLKPFYVQLRRKKINLALITDIEYHYKTIFYLKKSRWFVIALVSYNINPWIANYSMPIFKNNFFIQFFFIKFLFFLKKNALHCYYLSVQKFWLVSIMQLRHSNLPHNLLKK